MYHTIEFATDLVVDLEWSPRHRLEQVLLSEGTRVPVQLRPYVVEGARGPVEVADLFFEDGTAARGVPFACFTFVDEPRSPAGPAASGEQEGR
jgi:hypothetical protein